MQIVGQPCDMDLGVMKWRSVWPIFHSPVILPYILKTIWCMYIILWDYESVWPEVWPKNKCRSLWPIFHGSLILPCILKTIWCMNIIIKDYESVWPDVDLKINVDHCDRARENRNFFGPGPKFRNWDRLKTAKSPKKSVPYWPNT